MEIDAVMWRISPKILNRRGGNAANRRDVWNDES
jgi:hypothetical protein